MNTAEKIKYAEERIKELELLINHWKITINTQCEVKLNLVGNPYTSSENKMAA